MRSEISSAGQRDRKLRAWLPLTCLVLPVTSASQARRVGGGPTQPHTLEVLVLSLEGLQVLQRLLVGILELEELSAERARLLL